jgi:hypothetical protein
MPPNETGSGQTEPADTTATCSPKSTLAGGVTLAEADLIVERYHGQRVRLDCGGYFVEGVLRRGVRRIKGGGIPRFIVYGRDSNWRQWAEQFKADPDVYRRALRTAARPTEHYVRFDAADRLELVEVAA